MKNKPKPTDEEKEWIDYEKGWDDGYESGITDFEAVEREKEKLRRKGIPVIGDKKK